MEQLQLNEMMAFALPFMGTIIGIYIHFASKIKEFEIRLKIVEQQDDKILKKLDDVLEVVNDVRVELNNKQNRI
jgi:hypothetical protein